MAFERKPLAEMMAKEAVRGLAADAIDILTNREDFLESTRELGDVLHRILLLRKNIMHLLDTNKPAITRFYTQSTNLSIESPPGNSPTSIEYAGYMSVAQKPRECPKFGATKTCHDTIKLRKSRG